MKRITLAQAEVLADYFGYEIEINGSSMTANCYWEGVFQMTVRLV